MRCFIIDTFFLKKEDAITRKVQQIKTSGQEESHLAIVDTINFFLKESVKMTLSHIPKTIVKFLVNEVNYKTAENVCQFFFFFYTNLYF